MRIAHGREWRRNDLNDRPGVFRRRVAFHYPLSRFFQAGVFYYFDEADIQGFFRKLADRFPGCELFFDVASPLGVRVANKVALKAGGMEESSAMEWEIKRIKDIEDWDERIRVVESYPMFNNMKKTLSVRMKIGTFESDLLKIMSLVHILMKP